MNTASLLPVPVNSLGRHVGPMQDELAAIAKRVIASGYYVLGPAVSEFEQKFAAYCGVEHCIGVANGTDALELCLKAACIGPGQRVAVVANAAMYSTSAVLACGASPIFVDVSPTTATMDPLALENTLAASPEIAAVIVTHLYGRLADMDSILACVRSRGVVLIEDCAQAHGAKMPDGRRAGAIGDLASFSFYPTKNLGALGDGGAVVTSQPELAARVRSLRQYGWGEKYTNELPGGRNSRLDEVQAAMLSAMLVRLDEWNTRRRTIANCYSTRIINRHIQVPPAGNDDYVGHLYVVHTADRDALRSHLAALGIQSEVHYPLPDHRQPFLASEHASVTLPVTERQASTCLTLPCFPELTDAEVERVIDACNRF